MKFPPAAKIFLIAIAAALIAAAYSALPKKTNEVAKQQQETSLPTPALSSLPAVSATPSPIPSATSEPIPTPSPESSNKLVLPLAKALERITKKQFGIYVSPGNSPVSPERFTGYHTGVDFETFSDEQNTDVSVSAVCGGKVLYKNWVSGYGGVLIQSCKLDNQDITVLYGHLKLVSIAKIPGQDLSASEKIGNLGKGYSTETDGERKHLHLSIHKGTGINLKGYVQSQGELSGWLDALKYLE